MAVANIGHAGYGLRCTATEKNLPLALGLDGSAVLERLNVIPDGWLAEALDQLVVADVGVGADVAAVTIGDDQLERAATPTPELVQVEGAAKLPLVGVAGDVLVTTGEVMCRLETVAEVERDALVGKAGALATPVAEQVFAVGKVVRMGRGSGKTEAGDHDAGKWPLFEINAHVPFSLK